MSGKQNLLAEIVAYKRAEVKRAKASVPAELIAETLEPSQRDFRAALAGGREQGRSHLIAELKRASPSEGVIRERFDLPEILELYGQYASSVSVLTDYKYFQGSLEDLGEADIRTNLPLLRKDFIIDEYQILEARQFGADAILLIAAILEEEELIQLIASAKSQGLDALVEVHTPADLDKVLATPAEIIGINNRDLDTLKIDLKTTHQLAKQIPAGKIIVSESGIRSGEDIDSLKGVVDAVLVGTGILKTPNIEEKLRELTGNKV